MNAPRPDTRNAELAKIHIAKKDLRLDEETYRNMLFSVARVRSAGELDQEGRDKVLRHLAGLGWNPKPAPSKVLTLARRATEQKRRLMWRIEQWLAVAVPARDENYAHGMARNMFHVERIDFCTADQLHRIVAALEIDGKRNGWTIEKEAKR